MSGRRNDTPDTPLCRFTFKDGRHCSLPAHHGYEGLCYSHGTFARRASRQDNLRHILEPLAQGRSSAEVRRRALRGLSRAMVAGRLSPEQARICVRLTLLIDQSVRLADEASFISKNGPAWERLRQAIDDLDSCRDKNSR